jgi:hypothetical protein
MWFPPKEYDLRQYNNGFTRELFEAINSDSILFGKRVKRIRYLVDPRVEYMTKCGTLVEVGREPIEPNKTKVPFMLSTTVNWFGINMELCPEVATKEFNDPNIIRVEWLNET